MGYCVIFNVYSQGDITLYIIRGIPGAGKTTLAEHIAFSLNHAAGLNIVLVFEADQYFYTLAGYKFDGTKLREAHADCQHRTREWLKQGNNIAIVANTFTQRWEYQSYLNMAKEFDVPVQVIEVHGDFENIHDVPADKVASMKNRWEPHR